MFRSFKKKRIRKDHALYMYKALRTRTPSILELNNYLKIKSIFRK